MKKYRLDLCDIPDEFQNVDMEGWQPSFKKKNNRKRVYTRTARTLFGYDVWRTFDRQLIVPDAKTEGICKLMLSPALLQKTFGRPSKSNYGFETSGVYHFEDNNLDLFQILDYKKTQLYHGLPREDEYYTNARNLKRQAHKRIKKWPTLEEFWFSEEPQQFRVLCSDHADHRKFKRWLTKHLQQIEGSEFDFDKEANDKFYWVKDEICLGDYDKKGVLNQEMAIYKWDNQMFMTPDDLKKLSDDQKIIKKPPMGFDFSKAERIFIKKDDLKV